jgi:hypothetical protein
VAAELRHRHASQHFCARQHIAAHDIAATKRRQNLVVDAEIRATAQHEV